MKVGRPFKTMDWEGIEHSLRAGCTGEQVAAKYGMDRNTLSAAVKREKGKNFSDYSAEFYSQGDALLYEAQFAKAIGITKKGDTALLHWLGKVRLKQKEPEPDPPETTVPNEIYLQLEDENLKLKYELEQLKKNVTPEKVSDGMD